MIGRLRQLSEPRLRQQAGIEKSLTPVERDISCLMGEKSLPQLVPGWVTQVKLLGAATGSIKVNYTIYLHILEFIRIYSNIEDSALIKSCFVFLQWHSTHQTLSSS